MNVMRILFITILCVLLVGCANKSRQQAAGNAPIPAKDSIYHLPVSRVSWRYEEINGADRKQHSISGRSTKERS